MGPQQCLDGKSRGERTSAVLVVYRKVVAYIH